MESSVSGSGFLATNSIFVTFINFARQKEMRELFNDTGTNLVHVCDIKHNYKWIKRKSTKQIGRNIRLANCSDMR